MTSRFRGRARLLAALTAVSAFGTAALLSSRTNAGAADHADSPDTSEGNLDVNDLYVFNRGDNVVFAMTVSPLLTPGEATDNAAFNPNGLYQFKLDVERDGIADAVIQVTFSGSGTSQTVSVRGPVAPAVTGPTGNTIVAATPVAGAFNQTFSSGGMTVFAGPREDPFYIHLFGDESLTSVLNAAFSAALETEVGSPDEQSLSFSDPGVDDLAGLNTLAIVIELPKAAVADALGIGPADTFYAWATTSIRG